ncbi:ATP-binding protein [Arthrobacter sp. NamB2]|uniref:ATP-binding protein n=1 Tax=Arthrobacter sp. NamB2 TaxID=2576035 RepID=UPI00167419C0|nr:SbcC/MukB-like Walker B domain-containing protein [Arthrobacter sp. NamB2]
MSGTPLFTLEDTPQWSLEQKQLVNWGTFHGYHRVNFDRTTLISGPSGTGKSTLLDAYTALMMDSNTPFNGASNEGKGRARGKDQRSVLSYIWGTVDTVRDTDTDELVNDVLRGKNTATWSAIAATFRNNDGRAFTAIRLYHARVGASAADGLTMRMLTKDGTINLKDMEEFSTDKFPPQALTNRYPALQNHHTYTSFAQTIHAKLNIGQNGDGAKAMKLLARIQGGQHVKSVDALYKQLVLERPETYAKADEVIGHFDDLAKTHDAMQTAAQKVQVLAPISGYYEDMTAAQHARDEIDTFRLHAHGPTPFLLWQHTTEKALLDEASNTNRSAYKTAAENKRTALAEERELKHRVHQNREDQRANGGDMLERIDERLTDLSVEHDEAAEALLTFTSRTKALGRSAPEDRDEFDALTVKAQQFIDSFEERSKKLTEELDQVKREGWKVQDEREDVNSEYQSLKNRTTRLPLRYLNARTEVAKHTGMDPADLPFVAELIDISPENEQWRQAAELVMRGFATVMLVDRNTADKLRRSIDSLPLRDRINFRVADTGRPGSDMPTGTLAATLDFADSPFQGWLQQQITKQFSHQLVQTAEDFTSGEKSQVTATGQTKDGDKGAHGGKRGEFIIGFSNEAHREQVEQHLNNLDNELAILTKRNKNLDEQGRDLQLRREGHQYVLDTVWQNIDVAAVDIQLAEASAERDRIQNSNDKLATLEAEGNALATKLEDATVLRANSGTAMNTLDKEYGKLVDRQDALARAIDDAEDTTILTAEQHATLDAALAEYGVPGDLDQLTSSFNRVRRHLGERAAAASDREVKAAEALRKAFETYQRLWEDGDLGKDVQSYPDYRRILDGLVAEGLPERRQEFKREMALWSGRDLVPLAFTMRDSIDRISDRLNAVNAILANIPFGRDKDRLQIRLRPLNIPEVTAFLRRLRKIAETATDADISTDEETDTRFKDIASVITLIRTPDTLPKGATNTRETYLDVHRHIVITAERIDTNGKQLSVYDSLGGKSGGETQELIAFIVGAALRYQLGDEESSTRPRFAPVLLDEGFIKADAEFAGRAVGAWKKLGFQLIIGAPLDKVSGIERHVNLVLGINKPDHYSRISPMREVTNTMELEEVNDASELETV